MGVVNEEPKTPAEYFQIGRVWLDAAEDMAEGNQDAATLAVLSMASALHIRGTKDSGAILPDRAGMVGRGRGYGRGKPRRGHSGGLIDGVRPPGDMRSIHPGARGRLTKELRCNLCGKLLAEKAERGTVIICARCKTRNEA